MVYLLIMTCFATPPLLMWWMIVVQRRVRARLRERPRDETVWGPTTPYVETFGEQNGLSYGRSFHGINASPPDTNEIPGIQALHGRRGAN